MWDGFHKYLIKNSLKQENKQYNESSSDGNINFSLGLRHCLGVNQGPRSYYTEKEHLDGTDDPFGLALFL